MSTTEIAIIVCSIAFVVLVVYLVTLLISAKTTLSRVNQTLDCLQKQLITTNEISTNLHGKLTKIDPLFHALFLWGESIESRQRGRAGSRSRTAELLEWAILGADLWQKFTRR